MAKTNFQIFNEENTPERTYNDSEYKEATQRVGGVMPGMALSRMHNKMYYQWSAMCKAIANLIVNHGHDCMDSDVDGITRYLEEAIVGAATTEITAHRTAAELDHPEKSVKRKHLADNVYTLPAPEATNAARFVGGDHKVRDVTPSSIGAYSKNETDNLLAQKAPLASPALTGTPTAPTAGKGTNNGQIASTAFVAQAIAALVNSAPGALDTLQELAAALGNDANFATTVTNALAGKLGKTETAARAYELVGWTLEHNRSYAVGDIAYHKNLPSWARLGCVVAGTTGSNANVFSKSVKAGQYIIDGGVKWIVDDLRDGTPVGVVRGSLYVPDGYIKANGATVNRADYPRLVSLADRYGLWTDNAAANAGMFGRGNGSSTFVLPNWVDRMMQFAETAGLSVQAGLPNIHIKDAGLCAFGVGYNKGKKNGVIFTGEGGEDVALGHGRSKQNTEIDVSTLVPIYGRSSTVQPAAIRLIPIIRY